MNELGRMANFYSSNLLNKLKRLAAPLKTHFGIDCLSYSQMTPEGRFMQVCNQVDPSLYFFSQDLCKHCPFMCHPDFYFHNQAIISGGFPAPAFQEAQQVVKSKYGLENFLFIYKKDGDIAHTIHISSSNPAVPLNTIFLNNMSALSSFSDYFMEEWCPHLSQLDAYMIDADRLMGPIFHAKHPSLQFLPSRKAKLEFLKAIRSIDPLVNEQIFSQQEKRCIECLLSGYGTARAVSEQLHLSVRTVESYLQNIKNKLGCSTKSELIHRLNSYLQHGLIAPKIPTRTQTSRL